ncbi:hypothetical protein GCM10011610_00180 [Nocardia rhizosphaerihabitans]|uniref:Uncharacterized protein n=1 Tax=Nocardia rhizosphaerihabitans TaxID=1691570 RepID=A0ABQ2K2X0_9NOCA|nr:hypothetical protein GCM10011610_00180 [Nocardia rhizosphaerihabitans]
MQVSDVCGGVEASEGGGDHRQVGGPRLVSLHMFENHSCACDAIQLRNAHCGIESAQPIMMCARRFGEIR